jgi:hypothetical protein
MSNKLLYIYEDKELEGIREPVHERVELAQNLGYEVISLIDRETASAQPEEEFISSISEYVGVWVDVPSLDVSSRTLRLLQVAKEAGKGLLGHVEPEPRKVVEGLKIFIGLPDQAEEIK